MTFNKVLRKLNVLYLFHEVCALVLSADHELCSTNQIVFKMLHVFVMILLEQNQNFKIKIVTVTLGEFI